MTNEQNATLDKLWNEYAKAFDGFDDLTLARWMSQTLGHLKGRAWRLSHPLVGAYRLAAHAGHQRQIWHKRLVSMPWQYVEAPCCRAPMVPLFTRDVMDYGLVCEHCGESCMAFADMDAAIQEELRAWVAQYEPLHKVAHWDDFQKLQVPDYTASLEESARKAALLLAEAGNKIVPRFLEQCTLIIWEDHDECLMVRPEELEF